jgi:hypothetical protein
MKILPKDFNDQKGAVPVLAAIALLGLVSFFLVASSVPLKNGALSQIFTKLPTFAAGETTPVKLHLAATYNSISVYASYSGDAGNNSATMALAMTILLLLVELWMFPINHNCLVL